MTGGSSGRAVSVFRQILLGLKDTHYPQAFRTLRIERAKSIKISDVVLKRTIVNEYWQKFGNIYIFGSIYQMGSFTVS